MSLYLPPEMRWLGWIAGAEWPDGDEDKAWAVSDVWKDAAEELLALIAAVDEAKAATMAAYSDGDARAEMGARYDRMRSGESSIETLAKYMQQTSDSTFDMGTELQAEKITIIVTLCWLAVEIALAWLFPPTAPAAEAAAVGTSRAILQAARTATQKAIQQLAAKLGAPTVQRSFWRSLLAGKPALPTAKGWGVVGSEVIQGAAEEALITGAVQAGQVADDKRRDMDWSEVGYSAAAGGFAEPIGGAVAKGLGKGFAGGFGFNKNFGGQLDNWWGRAGQNTVVGAISDGLAGIAGSLFVAGISGQSVSDTLTGVGVAGSFIQGGMVGLADPSTFGRAGFAASAAGEWGVGEGNRFGRSGEEGEFGNGSSDGSRSVDQFGRQPSPGPTQPQSFVGGQQMPADGPQVPNRPPGSDFAGSRSGPTGPGPSSSLEASSSVLSPAGGQSPTGSGAAPEVLGNGPTGQGDTDSLPGAGGERGAAGPSGGASFGAGGGGGSADSGGPAGGEGGAGGSNGAEDQQTHRDQPGGPGGSSGGEHPGTSEQQADESGSRPGATSAGPSAGGETGDRLGGTPDPGAQSFHTGGPPAFEASGSAPASGPVQAQVAAQTGGVTPAPGLASNPGPAQSAGSGQTTAAAQSGRTETLTGQSSSADRPGTTAGPPDTAASPEAQQNRQAPVSETAPPSSTAETSRPEPPVTGSSAVTGDADWADLIGGDLPGDLESRWIPQAVEAVISTHTAGTTATPTGLGGAGSVPAGPPSATPTKSGPEPMSSPSSPAQLPNSPGAPAQNSNPLNTSNHGSGGAQPGAAVPKQPQAGSNHPRPGADHLEARSGQPPGGPDRPEPRPDQLEHTPDPAGAGPDRSGAQPPSREGDPGRPKRAHSETGPSPEPPTKRARAEESAPGSPQAGEQETGSDDVQPTPVPVPAEGGPQRVSPAQQNPRAPRSPQNSEAQRSADEDEAEQFADEESDWDGWTDPESETGPEPPLFGRPEPPMVLGNPAQSRVYGPGLLAPLEDPQLQQDLEDALRGPDGNFVRYADPRTHPAGGNPYGRMINPGMSNSDSRGNNCAETALAGLASFYGVPMVAAPRFPDVVNGAIERRAGERGSPQRVFQMLRTGQESYADGRPVPEQYTAMDKWIRHLGPGSAAYVTSMWKQNDPVTGRPYPDDGSVIFEAHTTLIVYPEGAEGPVWWDPQSGEMTLGPSPDMVDRSAGVAFIPIPGDRVIAAEPDIGTTSPAPFPYRPPTGPLVVPTARSADQPRLQLPDPATSRTFGPGSSNPDLHPGLQQVLESALRNGSGGFVRGAHPGTHPSAAAPYGVLVNAGGPDVPGRRGNHFDAALSALSSFLGKPRVAAAQHPGSAGLGSRAADADTARRAARWAGGNLHRFPDEQPMTQQFTNLHNWVHHLGPDSAALVFSAVPERDPATGAILRDPQDQPVIRVHPTVVVHPPAAAGPVWWNAVTGETWDHPPADLVAITGKLRFIPIPPGSTVVESDHLRERSRRMPERAEWSTSTGTAPHTTPPAIDYLSMPEGELADRPPAPAGPGPRSVEPDVVAVGAPPGDPDPAGRPPGSQQDIAPRPRLDRPWPPMVLSNGTDARAYGPGWLAPLEDPAAQVRLENAMRDAGGDFVRYADPRSFPAKGTHYGELINPGVPAAPGRNKNCLECVVTGLMTFLGRPQVALPRFTRFVDGVADSGGSDGLDQTRLYEMLGNQTNDFADGTRTISEQFLAIHEYVRNLGPGSAAFVRFNWQPTDDRTGRGMHRNGIPVLSGHATLVVYPVGARGPVWWDPQGDIATDKPSLRLVHSTRWVGFVPVPPGRSVQESFASVGPGGGGPPPPPPGCGLRRRLSHRSRGRRSHRSDCPTPPRAAESVRANCVRSNIPGSRRRSRTLFATTAAALWWVRTRVPIRGRTVRTGSWSIPVVACSKAGAPMGSTQPCRDSRHSSANRRSRHHGSPIRRPPVTIVRTNGTAAPGRCSGWAVNPPVSTPRFRWTSSTRRCTNGCDSSDPVRRPWCSVRNPRWIRRAVRRCGTRTGRSRWVSRTLRWSYTRATVRAPCGGTRSPVRPRPRRRNPLSVKPRH
nr:toxin glutamine deamidase domain-containing protein [Nocardia carnea]